MGYILLAKYASIDDYEKKKPIIVPNADAFFPLIEKKMISGAGWFGDKLHLDEVRLWFTDDSSLILGYAANGDYNCPGISYVPQK